MKLDQPILDKDLLKVAKKYKNINDFRQGDEKTYDKAVAAGLHIFVELTAHMTVKEDDFVIEQLQNDAGEWIVKEYKFSTLRKKFS